ncbi:MAG: AAA family ATPase [Burkholderiaceae bacterium]
MFGPRATGKSTLVRQKLGDQAFLVDLLDSRTHLRLTASPYDLEAMIAASGRSLVVIDEVQRCPELLNEVHRLLEKKKIRFLLTGSSARSSMARVLSSLLLVRFAHGSAINESSSH